MNDGLRIIVRTIGGPEALETERFDPASLVPGAGEVLVAHRAIGVNFIDTYQRSGLYPMSPPFTPGSEAAGEIVAVGAEVSGFAAGDRVAWFTGGPGGYASHRLVKADTLVPLADGISFETAAAAMLKAATAEMLIEQIAHTRPGQSVLVHAAAGGVGGIAVQWLKAIGARVIAHAGSPEKAAIARDLGADEALSCPLDQLAEAVRGLTGGAGVATVFDGVGAASFTASLDSLAKRGLMITYGNASGPVPPFSPLELTRRGSLFLTRPTLGNYVDTPESMRASAARLFEMIGSGKVTVPIGLSMPLEEAAEVHRRLESRSTTGSIVLLP
ncbi:quinone oxidoreductase family protein [Sphingomonas quercus]|uniref:Quinone oxidoreductase n=1 Tax=Sphingomonas quercus TaxID=2842451 RepID=A0ABS6BI86_9SPHN|nr:quinone oxidoreductase [Sphingomonas quercus]MBU3076930.1 quinone oxidoreductase [Sphingomonas quercus]